MPTSQSGRRLREALSEFASARGQAVFPPRVSTPEALAAPVSEPGVATRLEALLTWADVLSSVDLDSFREVFPTDPPSRGFSWASGLADQLMKLQATLAEKGLRLSGVADVSPEESERWHKLAELEREYDSRLAARGRRDPQEARIAASTKSGRFLGIERIVLLATPDPADLPLAAISAQQLPTDIVVFAPPDEAGSFDGWGRPLPGSWQKREFLLPNFEGQVDLCADPTAQASKVAAFARGYAERREILAVGIADPDVAADLERELVAANIPVFNPQGKPRRLSSFFALLTALADLADDPRFSCVEELGRCPDFLAYLGSKAGPGFKTVRWLGGLDRLRSDHLPADLESALAHAKGWAMYPEVPLGLSEMLRLRHRLTEDRFAEGAIGTLATLFESKRLRLSKEEDIRFEEGASDWTALLRECAAAAPDISCSDGWSLALRIFGEGFQAYEKEAGSIDLQGWLELLWEDSPHLVVTGFNEGRVPDAVAGDAFLPESLREKLGLRTNAERFARDAYILHAITAARLGAGRLDLLFGRSSAAGEPLRPSRLLLQCADAALPGRIAHLFRSVPEGGVEPGLAEGLEIVAARLGHAGKVGGHCPSILAGVSVSFLFEAHPQDGPRRSWQKRARRGGFWDADSRGARGDGA